MAERQSISTVHVFRKEQEDWDGPLPQHYQKHDTEKLCAPLQRREPEARVVMHL